jgi:hypothetical protein
MKEHLRRCSSQPNATMENSQAVVDSQKCLPTRGSHEPDPQAMEANTNEQDLGNVGTSDANKDSLEVQVRLSIPLIMFITS